MIVAKCFTSQVLYVLLQPLDVLHHRSYMSYITATNVLHYRPYVSYMITVCICLTSQVFYMSYKTGFICLMYITGFINPETCITVLEEEQEKEGLGWLKAKYSTAKDEYKISCVVFVCSCTMGVPRDLINCVREVIEEIDPKTSRRKCKLITGIINNSLLVLI